MSTLKQGRYLVLIGCEDAEPRVETVLANSPEHAIRQVARQGRVDPRIEKVVGVTCDDDSIEVTA